METSEGKIGNNIKRENAKKWWLFCAIFWPLLCLFFAGIILSDSARNMDERISDTFFTIIPLIFFAIGMSMRHRLWKERRYATTVTKAVVVSDGLKIQPGKQNYFPEFEFLAGETVYRVKYASGYSFRIVSEGEKVDLYYNLDNPQQFYVPVIRKHDSRLSLLLCSIGIVGPLLGLFAPLIRTLFMT